ncbi:phosphatase PAP2 family protein [Gloeocapsa sp. PCC 73106]|uniref:phosphatase PAP2 family protein n=1 Tax=Gloeocapsa sp. PCC 73106 TaxID=102232 RepID=UPI0002ABCB64|nr:phosphatase PAP2 family protein [Gloeocapsa sp. PCC 73106]ELR98864.1 membrane-associated phospholipid phosphatase [Gloeocapsa sp. PCC 73106]
MTNLPSNQINQSFTLGVILPLVFFAILTLIVAQSEKMLSWDTSILLVIHSIHKPILDRIAITTTGLGQLLGITVISIPILIVFAYQKRWRLLAYLSLTIASSALVNIIAKAIFHRLRPELWELSYALPHSFSFPSGHAMGSMTLVVALLIMIKKSRWSLLWGILGSLYILLIGWTRLYLGFHYPSDILGGWLLATTWTIGIYLLFKRYF